MLFNEYLGLLHFSCMVASEKHHMNGFLSFNRLSEVLLFLSTSISESTQLKILFSFLKQRVALIVIK